MSWQTYQSPKAENIADKMNELESEGKCEFLLCANSFMITLLYKKLN